MSSNRTQSEKEQQAITNLLRAQEDGRVSSTCLYKHHVHTPFALCEEILGQVQFRKIPPVSKYLVMFNLEFLQRLKKFIYFDVEIVYYYTTDINKARLAKMLFPDVEVINELEDGMKFDVIVGNPPFQKNGSDAKRWTLWEEFVRKSLSLAETVALITPQSITSPGPFALIKDRVSILNVDVSKYFTVGSTFCYFIAHRNKEAGKSTIITDTDKFEIDITKVPFLPLSVNKDTLAQIEYLSNRTAKKWARGELHTSKKELFLDGGKYDVFHTNAQQLKTDTEHPNKTKIRVAVSLSGYPKFRVLSGMYASQACFWTEFNNIKDAELFAEECNSEYIQEILKVFKWSGWNSKEVIQCL